MLDGATGREILACRDHTASVNAVISLGDLSVGSFASGSDDRALRVWGEDGTVMQAVRLGRKLYSLSLWVIEAE